MICSKAQLDSLRRCGVPRPSEALVPWGRVRLLRCLVTAPLRLVGGSWSLGFVVMTPGTEGPARAKAPGRAGGGERGQEGDRGPGRARREERGMEPASWVSAPAPAEAPGRFQAGPPCVSDCRRGSGWHPGGWLGELRWGGSSSLLSLRKGGWVKSCGVAKASGPRKGPVSAGSR